MNLTLDEFCLLISVLEERKKKSEENIAKLEAACPEASGPEYEFAHSLAQTNMEGIDALIKKLNDNEGEIIND